MYTWTKAKAIGKAKVQMSMIEIYLRKFVLKKISDFVFLIRRSFQQRTKILKSKILELNTIAENDLPLEQRDFEMK